MKKFIIFVIILALAVAAISYFMTGSVIPVFAKDKKVNIDKNLGREQVSEILAEAFTWDEKEKESFPVIWMQMQWLAFGSIVADVTAQKYDWTEKDKEVFLTSTTRFLDPKLDPLVSLYIPGEYIFTEEQDTIPKVAAAFISRLKDMDEPAQKKFIEDNLSEKSLTEIKNFVEREQELLPDLSPLPPQDLVIEKDKDRLLLRFSTIYYNHGRGVLELRADTETAGIRKDIDRDVFQRIYKEDGTFRQKLAGHFLWHQQHLHYHFADFAIYDLEAVEVKGPVPDLSGILMKSTFCIRDVSKIEMELEYRTEAKYQICGKEKQGISVGWGDTYFYTYPDQMLNITDLPSGRYKLSFIINPADRFEEITKENNTSSVVLDLDMTTKTFKVVSEEPEKYPEVDHVYPTQDCPVCTL